MCGKALMFSLYTYLRIILMVFINMAKNIGPDGDSAYFSAKFQIGHVDKSLNINFLVVNRY